MPNVRRIAAAILLVTQAAWLHIPAQAQNQDIKENSARMPRSQERLHQHPRPSAHPHSDTPLHRSPGHHTPAVKHPAPPHGQHHLRHHPHMGQAAMHKEQLAQGGFFSDQQRDAARIYYSQPEQRGYCPPGLRKKSHDCLPPGQARAWQRGQPLPPSVVYYSLPRSMEITLGPPPPGHRYVRVASDILLLAVGTGIVVDAMEDLVH
jgi:Ni/Co efflux regulator RcnB